MKVLRIIIGIAGAVFLIWFVLPLCLSVNLNIGNITGIAVSLLIMAYAVFMPHINRTLTAWKVHKTKKWISRGIKAIVLVITGLVIMETTCMVRAACKAPDKDATVVVLGCRVYGERPSLSLQERLKAAYSYLDNHENAVCVLSGGKGDGENISEAECMYRYLIDQGIDPSRLYKEEKSTTTRENLSYSKMLIEEKGLNPSIAIATSEYHEYRAGRIARALGMEYGAIPAKTAIWLFPTYYIRELYGILYEYVF